MTDTSANRVAKFNKEGVLRGLVYSTDPVFDDGQVKHLGVAMAVQHPRLGALDVVRAPMQIAGVECARNPTPERGQHTDEVLAGSGFSLEEISTLRSGKVI